MPMKHILPVIVISQFLCTSLWFAGNAVMGGLASDFGIVLNDMSHLTSMVQFGFITGTLVFALLSIADRYSPSKVFFFCALLGSIFNLGVTWELNTLITLLSLRFFTGFFLAGIYPVGMKIAADYYEKGLGKSLGFLVGALVLGTALPHLLKSLTMGLPWKMVLYSTSSLALLGGLSMMLFVPNGPYRKPGLKVDLSLSYSVFKNSQFRSAAFGYFGHMWELYAFWAFVPVILMFYQELHQLELNTSVWSFLIIGIGGLGCAAGGYISEFYGTKNTAFSALLISCCCCLISPVIILFAPTYLFKVFLFIWGVAVITDSPLFSTLVAQNAPQEAKGTALTIVNCIGFFITIFSIQLLQFLNETVNSSYIYMVLAVGPIIGLYNLKSKKDYTI